jgi:hypothetical protein
LSRPNPIFVVSLACRSCQRTTTVRAATESRNHESHGHTPTDRDSPIVRAILRRDLNQTLWFIPVKGHKSGRAHVILCTRRDLLALQPVVV